MATVINHYCTESKFILLLFSSEKLVNLSVSTAAAFYSHEMPFLPSSVAEIKCCGEKVLFDRSAAVSAYFRAGC